MNVVDLVNAKIGDLHREPGLEPNDRHEVTRTVK